MKRLAAIVMILCLAMAGAMSKGIDPRLQAMGNVGIAVIGNNSQSFPNPAGVYFDNTEFTFAARGAFGDTIGETGLPYLPEAEVTALFCGEMIAFDIGIDIGSDNYRPGSGNVDIYQTTTIGIAMSAGYDAVSVGVGVTGGSVRQRIDVPMNNLYDNAMQFMFTNFDRVVNSEFMQVNAGLMIRRGNLSIGMLMDNILEKNGAKTTLSFNSIFAETGIGMYWARDEYSKRGKMNNFVYSFAFELDNIFRSASRRMNVGGELSFRLVRDFSVSARAGYTALMRSFSHGTLTLGVGAHIRKIEVAFNAILPADAPAGLRMTATVLF